MVGLDADFQTPPAIVRQIPYRRSAGGTGEMQATEENRGKENEPESFTTSRIQGGTNAAGESAKEDHARPEYKPTPGKMRTAAFSQYLFNRKTAELVALLDEFKPIIHSLEGAGAMVAFRRSLAEIWHVAGQLPREKLLVVSAVEEAIRNTKWRELSVGQVEVLQRVLSSAHDTAEMSKSQLSRAFRALNKSQIAVFPSASSWDGVEDGDEPQADNES